MTSFLFQGSKHAQLYVKFRPCPPQKLVDRIITYLKNSIKSEVSFNNAIDIGCGSGQSTVVLSPYFKAVLGLDISEAQIKYAKESNALNNIEYKVCDALRLPVSSNSTELVTLCQSIHWFNPLDDLYKEISRVLVPNGVAAAYGYWIPLPETNQKEQNDEIKDLICGYLYKEKLGKYWNDERVSIESYYSDILFPFKNFKRINIVKESNSSLSEYMGYFSTWSSYQKLHKEDPGAAKELLNEVEKRLKLILGNSNSSERIFLTLHTDYFMLIGNV